MAGSENGSQTPTRTPSGRGQPQSRRQQPRLRLACLRCQRRKIRVSLQRPGSRLRQMLNSAAVRWRAAHVQELQECGRIVCRWRERPAPRAAQSVCPGQDATRRLTNTDIGQGTWWTSKKGYRGWRKLSARGVQMSTCLRGPRAMEGIRMAPVRLHCPATQLATSKRGRLPSSIQGLPSEMRHLPSTLVRMVRGRS